MMRMKKALWVLLSVLLTLSLASCTSFLPSGETSQTAAPSAPTSGAAEEAYRVQISYYQAQNKRLEEEILSLKTQLYTQRVEYEALIADLSRPVEKDEDVFTYTLGEGIATVTGYIGKDTELVIPALLGGCPVKAIGDGAFQGQVKLVSVVIPESVTSIGWFAFSGCVSLGEVTVPATVTSIGYDAFSGCTAALTLVTPADSYARSYALSYGIKVK